MVPRSWQPLRRPEVLLAMGRSAEAELLAIGPDLTDQQIDRLLYEYANLRQVIHSIGEAVRNTPAYDLRYQLPALLRAERKPPQPVDPLGKRWRPAPCFPDQGRARYFYQPKVASR